MEPRLPGIDRTVYPWCGHHTYSIYSVVTGGEVVVSVSSDDVGGVCVPVVIESNEAESATQIESGAFQLCFVV